MVVKLIDCPCQPQCICNPLRTIPATYPLDKEWRELRQDHPRPIITISLGIFIKFFYRYQLFIANRHTDPVVVFFRFVELFSADAISSKGCDTYASVVGHNQFCVRIFTVGSVANDAVMPASLTLVEGYTNFMWFCRLSYPIVL